VFSASSYYSDFNYNDNYLLFKSHISKIIFAIFAFILAAITPYELYKKSSKIILLISIVTLLLTPIIGIEINGAKRWISLGIFSFQPAEFAKLVLIIHISYLIIKKGEAIRELKGGLSYPLIWISVVSFLVIIQPNVSTSVIIVLVSFMLLYVGGARPKHLALTLGGVGSLAASIMLLFPHSRSRIFTYIDSLLNGGDINVQVMQAKIALGSGGWIGKGLGHSRQSDLFLPEAYGDFIFSILGEETGFIGALSVLLIYFILFFIGVIIAKRCNDSFAQLLIFGLSFNIIFSAFINISVVMGILPTTGITLPFISFGGTSIIIFALSIGIITNIALRTIKKQSLAPIAV
jgi:cell division protein FtsW